MRFKKYVSIILLICLVNSVNALLAEDYIENCKDEVYLLDNSDYVVVGKVSKVEVKWDDGNIHTYQYVDVSDYLKGSELDNDLLIIDSLGGCVSTMCQDVEDGDYVLEEDKEYTLYLSSKGNYFSIYCMGYGAKLKTESDKDEVEPVSDEDTEEPITDKDVVEPIADKDQTEPVEDKDTVEIIADKDMVEPIEVQIDTPEGESKIKIEKISEDSISIREKDTTIETSKKLIIEEKKLFMETAKGKKEIKIMPSTASEIAVNQLKLKYVEIELKEVGKPIYEITGKKEVKIFGLFKKEMTVKTYIDAETGDIEKTKKPWWSFLATG